MSIPKPAALGLPERLRSAGIARVMVVVILGLAVSCVKTVGCGPLEGAEEVTVSSQGIVDIEGSDYVVLPAVGRGMMPGPFYSPSGIAAGVTVQSALDGPSDLVQPICIRVSQDGSSWQTRLDPIEQGADSQGRGFVSANATGGPGWEADTAVNVTVWVRRDARLYEIYLGTVSIEAHV